MPTPQELADIRRKKHYLFQAMARQALLQFANESRSMMAGEIKKFLKALSYNQSSAYKGMLLVNQTSGEAFRQASIASYNSVRSKTKPYRFAEPSPKLRRYSNGAMLTALQSSAMASADSRSVHLINKGQMTKIAPQWYRLNFGAGGKGDGGRAPKEVSSRRRSLSFNLSMANFDPSSSFRVPDSVRYVPAWSTVALPTNAAYFRLEKYKDKLVPAGPILYLRARKKADNKLSGGFKGRHFLEAGLDAFNEEYPRQVYALLQQWFGASKDSIGRRKPFVFKPKPIKISVR